MTFKALLLGSAAALATAGVSGGAQAADLMAESVDYVRVCDAFGTGYWYIPGTDQCLKFGGRIRFEIDFGEDEGKGDHGWNFETNLQWHLTYAKMTSHGPLIGYAKFGSPSTANKNGSKGTDGVIDEMYIQWGHLTLGFTDSLLNSGGGPAWDGDSYGRGDWAGNGIWYTQQLGAHTLSLGLEDPWYQASDDTSSAASGAIPNLTARLESSWEHVDWAVAAGYVDGGSLPSGWAATGWLEFDLDTWMHGASVKLVAIYGQDAGGPVWVKGADFAAGSHWGWLAGYSQGIADGWTFNAAYSTYDGPITNAWNAALDLTYRPVDKMKIVGGVAWGDSNTSSLATTGILRFEYAF